MPPNNSIEFLKALYGNSGDATSPDLTALLGGKSGGFSNTANLSSMTGQDMGMNYGMAAAGLGGAAIPFIQAARLGKQVKNYKPTNLVPQQAYDVVQNLAQQLNAPVTNYGQRLQNLNDARAARMAYAKKAGSSSDYLRSLYASEDMYNKGMGQIEKESGTERANRRTAYYAALAGLGSQEAASAQKNREALAALKQARDISYAKSGENLINGLVNSVVLKGNKGAATTDPTGQASGDYTDFFNQFIAGQEAGAASGTPYKMGNAYGKPQLYNPQFMIDPAFKQKNSLYPFIKP
jgi:hypothetical protein